MPTSSQSLDNPQSCDHRKGLVVTLAGVLLLTLDTPLLRLVDGNQWTVMFWRGLLVFFAMSAWWGWQRQTGAHKRSFLMGPWGLFVSFLYGLSNVFFVIALHNTSVANLLVILALNPLICALLSLVFLDDRISISTWVAIAACFFGVAIIVSDSIGTTSFFGDLMALLAILTLSAAIVFTRKSGQILTTAPGLAGLIAAVVAFPFADSLALDASQWGYMATNGILVMAIASGLLAYAPSLLPAAHVAMLYLLETVLGPLWVWLAVGEQPSRMAFIGGAIVIATLIIHSTANFRSRTSGSTS